MSKTCMSCKLTGKGGCVILERLYPGEKMAYHSKQCVTVHAA
jgi:hypothetical protein